jgi:putative membrane protein
MPRRKLFSESELKRITEATRQAELRTSGEIVTVIASRAGSYAGHVLMVAALVMAVFSVAYLTLLGTVAGWLQHVFWTFDARHALVALVLGQALVFILTYVLFTALPGLKRLIISRRDQAEKVRRKAESDFFRQHVSSTKGKTGVLIYIALFERRVELLVDAGIAAKVPTAHWQSVVDGIIHGIKRRQFVDVLCAQIARCGEILSKDFPRRARDVNELPDRPVLE